MKKIVMITGIVLLLFVGIVSSFVSIKDPTAGGEGTTGNDMYVILDSNTKSPIYFNISDVSEDTYTLKTYPGTHYVFTGDWRNN